MSDLSRRAVEVKNLFLLWGYSPKSMKFGVGASKHRRGLRLLHQRNSVMYARLRALALFSIFAACVILSGKSALASMQVRDSDPQEAIRRRVEEFYALLHGNQLAKAEAYVSRDSLEKFRDLENNPFVSVEIKSVKLGPEGASATVEVTILFMDPRSPIPIPFPRKTDWLLEDGQWRLIVPDAMDAFRQRSARATGEQHPPALKFSQDKVQLGRVRQGEKKQVRVSLTNVSDQPVRITEVVTDCKCLQAKTDKETYEPGAKGEMTIDFDPMDYLYNYQQTIVVITEPGDLRSPLMVEAQIQPRRRASPKQQDAAPATAPK